MSLKCDGTNGILQSYDYQTPATGFSYTFAAGTQMLFMVPASTLATGTITMPSAPADGMVITFSSSQQITALTLQGNSGQSISGAVTFLPAQCAASYVYRLANATWYPSETVPGTGSQLVSGVSQATTSGTSKDFTGIPSWVKRITLILNGVSTNGSSVLRVQIGSGSINTTADYNFGGFVFATAGAAFANTGLAGFDIESSSGSLTAASIRYGTVTLVNVSGNIWVLAYNGGYSGTTYYSSGAGNKSLSGTLDRIRITTNNGTDTFDAGSVNILYE